MKYIVYKITRDDGKIYIGTTNNKRIYLRMKLHSYTERFKNHNFEMEILEESTSYDYIMEKEEDYIKKFDSYNKGLNKTIDGKGNHMCPNFTTKGYKHSEETKKKISEKLKGKWSWFKGKKHTEESKKKMSIVRKGKRNTHKLNVSDIIQIRNDYDSTIKIDDDRIGKIMKNGHRMTYKQSFCEKYGKMYNVTTQNIRHIIDRKNWIDV